MLVVILHQPIGSNYHTYRVPIVDNFCVDGDRHLVDGLHGMARPLALASLVMVVHQLHMLMQLLDNLRLQTKRDANYYDNTSVRIIDGVVLEKW